LHHPRHRGQIDRGVLADRRMRAAARLHPLDALGRQGPRAGQDELVLLGVDVVRHDDQVVALPHRLAEHLDQGRLAGADGAADADAERAMGHERNSLVYWVSWSIEQRSSIGVAVPRSSGSAAIAAAAVSATTGSSAAWTRSP